MSHAVPAPPPRHRDQPPATSTPRADPSAKRSWRGIPLPARGLVLVLLLAPPGCQPQPPSPAERLPTLDQVDTRLKEKDRPLPEIARLPSSTGVVEVQMITLPLDQPLVKAWRQVDGTVIPRPARQAWRANGIRIGRLSRNHLDELADALPDPIGVSTNRLYASEEPSAIRSSGRLSHRLRIRLPQAGRGFRTIFVRGGRMRLLARLTRGGGGRFRLGLIPHHYKRRVTLKPRSPMSKRLDGRIFQELALNLTAPRRDLLVLGLNRKWHPPGKAETAKPAAKGSRPNEDQGSSNHPPGPGRDPTRKEHPRQGENTTGEPSSGTAYSPGWVPEPVPPHLGRALLAIGRPHRSVQFLMLIRITPLPGNRAAPSGGGLKPIMP